MEEAFRGRSSQGVHDQDPTDFGSDSGTVEGEAFAFERAALFAFLWGVGDDHEVAALRLVLVDRAFHHCPPARGSRGHFGVRLDFPIASGPVHEPGDTLPRPTIHSPLSRLPPCHGTGHDTRRRHLRDDRPVHVERRPENLSMSTSQPVDSLTGQRFHSSR